MAEKMLKLLLVVFTSRKTQTKTDSRAVRTRMGERTSRFRQERKIETRVGRSTEEGCIEWAREVAEAAGVAWVMSRVALGDFAEYSFEDAIDFTEKIAIAVAAEMVCTLV